MRLTFPSFLAAVAIWSTVVPQDVAGALAELPAGADAFSDDVEFEQPPSNVEASTMGKI